MRPSATVRNNVPSGQLVGSWDADARNVLDHARANLDQALSDRRELAAGERIGTRDRGADAVQQPKRAV
jgi:hypothetical protein